MRIDLDFKSLLSCFLCFCAYSCNDVYETIAVEVSVHPFMSKKYASSQGMTIYDDKVFVLKAGGYCDVYSFTDKHYISSFVLGSESEFNHCNCANFGIENADGAVFPLLYVTNGQIGSLTEWHCKVENITYCDNYFYSECVQTIILDNSNFKSTGYEVPWGCPQWLIDRERGFLWVWSANLRTIPSITGDYSNNKYHATKFRIPKLSEGKVVTLTANDILDQVSFEFDAYSTQGGCMADGKIYFSYGFGDEASSSKIRIYDTDTGHILKRMDLSGLLDVELEDLSLYNKKLYVNTMSQYIYEITNF